MPHPVYGRVAWCINGGGSKGICQSGMLQRLQEFGIGYDTIYGSSVGSLNGTLVHQGDFDKLKHLWMTISNDQVYTWNLWDAANPFSKKACLYDSSPLLKTIQRYLDLDKIYGNPKDFVISATDYSTWAPFFAEVKELAETELPYALYASASPPVYFPFVKLRGQLLADAGILTNYNIHKAVQDGADTLIILGFAHADPHEPVDIKDNVGETLSIATYGYFNKELAFIEKINEVIASCPGQQSKYRPIKVVKIVPEKSTGLDLLDFNYKQDRETLWKLGYELADEVLKRELVA